jgi:histidine phosphotransferase ChpT
MSQVNQLTALDLAALLCSRVCHDIISPVGAVINGLEVLDEDNGDDMKSFAMELINKSARQASWKLQFARLAFGAAGSAGSEIDLGDAQSVAIGFMNGEKADLHWSSEPMLMPKNFVKLLLNLIMLAASTVPRGGTINLSVEGPATRPSFRLKSTGPSARIPGDLERLIAGDNHGEAIDAHVIQPVYTGMLARECAMSINFAMVGDDVELVALPA